MYRKWRRFFIRQYFYPIFLFLLVLFLIKWNFSTKTDSTGSRFDIGSSNRNELVTPLVLLKPILEKNDKLTSSENAIGPVPPLSNVPKEENLKENLPPLELNTRSISPEPFKKPKGGNVSLEVYLEAQCPDTTGFIKRQLVPTWEKLKSTERVHVLIVPFGKANCERKGDDFECTCQHGKSECELNQLMNCVIDRLIEPKQFIGILGCIQGKLDITSAFHDCLSNHLQYKWLWKCTNSKRGRFLHALAGKKTAKLGAGFNFVPWVVLNGERVNDAFYALEENLCKRLDSPKPIQCEHFI